MNNSLIVLSRSSLDSLLDIFIPKEIPDSAYVELSIRFQSDDLKVREFSNYLTLLDRFYGRLYYDGIYAYGHRPKAQLEINEIKKGSVEVVILESIQAVTSNPNLIIAFLLLKYLPNIIKSSAEAVKYFAESYKYYQEGSEIREKRMFRKNLRKAIQQDANLKNLNKRQIDQIIKMLESMYAKEYKRLPRAIDTAKTKIVSILLKIKKS